MTTLTREGNSMLTNAEMELNAYESCVPEGIFDKKKHCNWRMWKIGMAPGLQGYLFGTNLETKLSEHEIAQLFFNDELEFGSAVDYFPSLRAAAYDIVSDAHDLIDQKAKWCSGALALDPYGEEADPADYHSAVRFCASGAVEAACYEMTLFESHQTYAMAMLQACAERITGVANITIEEVNDDYGYDAVMFCFADVLARRPATLIY